MISSRNKCYSFCNTDKFKLYMLCVLGVIGEDKCTQPGTLHVLPLITVITLTHIVVSN